MTTTVGGEGKRTKKGRPTSRIYWLKETPRSEQKEKKGEGGGKSNVICVRWGEKKKLALFSETSEKKKGVGGDRLPLGKKKEGEGTKRKKRKKREKISSSKRRKRRRCSGGERKNPSIKRASNLPEEGREKKKVPLPEGGRGKHRGRAVSMGGGNHRGISKEKKKGKIPGRKKEEE